MKIIQTFSFNKSIIGFVNYIRFKTAYIILE